MSNLRQAIDKLMSSPHYKKLATYEPPFNPFDIVGATHRELTHSSVLAWLLRDESNKEFRQKFVTWIIRKTVAKAEKNKEDFIELQKLLRGFNPENSRLKPKEVKTEYSLGAEAGFKGGSIDVFVHFESLELVVGIEVKVNAGEGSEQVTKYQNFLCQEYPDPGYKKVIVFLTPGGYPSETKSDIPDVPVLEMSWSNIAGMIKKMRSALGGENDFRMQFSQHLERNIVIDQIKEEQWIVRELLSEGDNAETLNKIITNETEEQRIVRELLSEGDNAETLNKIITNETEEQRIVREQSSGGGNAETLNKIINNMSSLRTSLECEFWIELREQLQAQLGLRDEELEFQLYKSAVLEPEVIWDKRLEEYINKWRDRGSPGLTFRIRSSSLNGGPEVACRITYDPPRYYYLYYGFVLCKKGNIEERVEIKNDNHEEYLELYRELLKNKRGKIKYHGPDKENGWLRWKEYTDVEICFADGPKLFNTLVDIKKRKKEEVVKELVKEICDDVKKIMDKQEKSEQLGS